MFSGLLKLVHVCHLTSFGVDDEGTTGKLVEKSELKSNVVYQVIMYKPTRG